MRIGSTTRRKLEALYQSEERRHLLLIRKHLMQPLGDWQCTPNLYSRQRRTIILLPAITGLVYGVGGPTIPIPVEEQQTDRIPLEV